jgi:hypothetical protein
VSVGNLVCGAAFPIQAGHMTNAAALLQIKADLAPFERGPLQNNVRAHYEHLQSLTASLQRIGLDEETIDQQVHEVFESYKAELLRNINRIHGQSERKSSQLELLRDTKAGAPQ